ncbi:MAG: hypothetical protein HY327_05180 [Chloroflexi bacterium]|nr:hypothetical protein [Chloroflexota bacterium]
MRTLKLLWNFIWRGGAWGTLFGAVGGTGVGAWTGVALLAFGLTQTETAFTSADIVRGIFAMLFFALIGSGVGSLFGLPTGFFLGVLIGAVTRAFFYPLQNAPRHRVVVASISALLGAVGSLVAFAAILQFYARRAVFADSLIFFAVPALIAGACAVFIGGRVARWYEHQSNK